MQNQQIFLCFTTKKFDKFDKKLKILHKNYNYYKNFRNNLTNNLIGKEDEYFNNKRTNTYF